MKREKILLSIKMVTSLVLLAVSAQATALNLLKGNVVMQIGGYVSSQGKSQSLAMKNLIGDSYSVNSGSETNALAGLGYILKGQDINNVHMAYGVNAFYLTDVQVSGKVTQEHLFTNLSYQYNISHLPVYAVARAIIDMNCARYAITLDAGLGPNFITTSQFQEHSLDGGVTLPDHVFSGQTTSVLSATAGIGVRFNSIFKQLPLECGYRFFYLGQGSLDKQNSQQIDTMKTGNSYANALLCSVTF